MSSQHHFLNIPVYTTQQVNDIAEHYNSVIYNLHQKIDLLEEKIKTLEEKKLTIDQLSEFFTENVKKLTIFLNNKDENPITDPNQSERHLREKNTSLFHFYRTIYDSTNPNGKNPGAQEKIKKQSYGIVPFFSKFQE